MVSGGLLDQTRIQIDTVSQQWEACSGAKASERTDHRACMGGEEIHHGALWWRRRRGNRRMMHMVLFGLGQLVVR